MLLSLRFIKEFVFAVVNLIFSSGAGPKFRVTVSSNPPDISSSKAIVPVLSGTVIVL